jgi:hypothetical protein
VYNRRVLLLLSVDDDGTAFAAPLEPREMRPATSLALLPPPLLLLFVCFSGFFFSVFFSSFSFFSFLFFSLFSSPYPLCTLLPPPPTSLCELPLADPNFRAHLRARAHASNDNTIELSEIHVR